MKNTGGALNTLERTWSGGGECVVLLQGLVDVDSVGRQGSSHCGQTTCHQLSTPNQLRAVDLRERDMEGFLFRISTRT